MKGLKYLRLFDTHAEYQTYITGQNAVLPNVSYCEDNNDVHYNPWIVLIVKYTISDATNPTQLYFYFAEEGQETMWARGIDMFDKVEIDGQEVSISNLDTAQGTYQLAVGEHTVKYTMKDPTLIGAIFNEQTGEVDQLGATFFDCATITSVKIPTSVTTIGGSAFSGCIGLTSITIPTSVTTIGGSAFSGCIGLTSITIPTSVTTIGGSAFSSCTGLTSITIPNSVMSIGNHAFQSCSGLTSVTIPNSVTSIGNNVFNGCSGLASITSLATTAPTIQSNTFNNVKTGGTLTVPSGSTGYDVWMGTGNYYLGKYGWTKVEQ